VVDFRPIFFVAGILLTTLAVAMFFPMAADLIDDHPDWKVFAGASGLTLFIGVTMVLTARAPRFELNIRQAFLLTTGSWLVLTMFAALPFAFAELEMSYTDAFFEAMSGITTTGSTVMIGLDNAPSGILLWRALLQWLGGVGIIVMAVAILPMLQIGGMQLFRTESSDRSDKVLPRMTQVAGGISIVYLALTTVCVALLLFVGVDGFDAVAHAMTTIATGGFSTYDASVGALANPDAEVIITIFMAVGGLPFVLYLQALRGDPGSLFRDIQVRAFLSIIAVIVIAMTVWRVFTAPVPYLDALREVAFNVVSIITGTGYATTDYHAWGAFANAVFFFIMFIGGCAGSTTCGIKIFRFQVLYVTAEAQIQRLMQPHGVFVPHFNRRPIEQEVATSVMSFFFLFTATFAILALLLGAIGLDFVTAISGAATAICNVGPALGDIIGPSGTFAPLPDSAKWVLSAGMLLGRLELFTVLVLLTPSFWRG
jgi:trk system potassium uptake protein TrkH